MPSLRSGGHRRDLPLGGLELQQIGVGILRPQRLRLGEQGPQGEVAVAFVKDFVLQKGRQPWLFPPSGYCRITEFPGLALVIEQSAIGRVRQIDDLGKQQPASHRLVARVVHKRAQRSAQDLHRL